MRLSQTPEDISDHQRRVSDPRRINLGVGAAWMSGKLEPRAWPGENRWGFGAPVTPRYPQVGQPPNYTGAAGRGGPGRSFVQSTTTGRLNEIVQLYQAGSISTPEQVVQRIMTALRVDRNTALTYYNTIRSRLIKKAPTLPGRADKKGERNGVLRESRPPDIRPGKDPYPTRTPVRPQDALPAGKTYGGRTTITKHRSGETDRPEEARIIAGWDVENQGSVTAKASLRLRMGATRILATSIPVDVVAGSQRPLALRWSIPSDMAIGGHSLSLDIMQTWQVDGSTHRKLVAVHEVTVSVVEGRRATSPFMWARQPEDVDLDIGI